MKNNKLPIIIGVVLGILLLIALAIFMFLRQNKITITYISDNMVSSSVEVRKGEKITLPETKKDGYVLEGWYYNGTKVSNGVSFKEDTVLIAKWQPETAKTMVITFDTDGGNKLEAMTVECDSQLNLPTPTKSGYKFLNWYDKNEIVISNETKLVCEDISLKAKWEKNEEPKPSSSSSSAKPSSSSSSAKPSSSSKKEYTCPSGYTLNGTKCTIETSAKEKCPDGTKVISGGICATITGSARKDYSKSCEKAHVTYMSFAGYVEGKVVNWGITGCAYYKTNDASKETCESHGFKWVTPESACYVKWDTSTVIKVCTHLSGYVDVPNPNDYVTNTGLNAGCYPTSNKVKYCDDGYTLTNNKCVKTIGATLK